MESGSSVGGTSSVDSIQGKPFPPIRLENPFTFKVGQVFTGFGVGCGVGIGVGRPLNLGTLFSSINSPTLSFYGLLEEVMDFSGVFKPKNGDTRTETAANKSCILFCSFIVVSILGSSLVYSMII